MVLCDTNIFIHAFNGNADTINERNNNILNGRYASIIRKNQSVAG